MHDEPLPPGQDGQESPGADQARSGISLTDDLVALLEDGKTYLEYHIEQIVASAAQYGWEAFRYDAAPLSIEHFPTVKQVLAALDPPAGIGNNLGRSLLGPKSSDAWKIYCRDGSLMMDESIVMAFHSPTDPRRRWTDWIDYLRQASGRGVHLTPSDGAHHA